MVAQGKKRGRVDRPILRPFGGLAERSILTYRKGKGVRRAAIFDQDHAGILFFLITGGIGILSGSFPEKGGETADTLGPRHHRKGKGFWSTCSREGGRDFYREKSRVLAALEGKFSFGGGGMILSCDPFPVAVGVLDQPVTDIWSGVRAPTARGALPKRKSPIMSILSITEWEKRLWLPRKDH